MISSSRGSAASFAIVLSGQSVSHNHATNLPHLVCLCVSASRLKVEDLLNAVFRENVVTSFDALDESEPPQQVPELRKRDRRVGSSIQYPTTPTPSRGRSKERP
jgi:hypothetical protein